MKMRPRLLLLFSSVSFMLIPTGKARPSDDGWGFSSSESSEDKKSPSKTTGKVESTTVSLSSSSSTTATTGSPEVSTTIKHIANIEKESPLNSTTTSTSTTSPVYSESSSLPPVEKSSTTERITPTTTRTTPTIKTATTTPWFTPPPPPPPPVTTNAPEVEIHNASSSKTPQEVAEEYIAKNFRVITDFLGELARNQMEVAILSVNTVQRSTLDLQLGITKVLSGKCRNTTECTSEKEAVQEKIEEYEKIMQNNKEFRSLTAALQNECKSKLFDLHERYSEILRHTLNYEQNETEINVTLSTSTIAPQITEKLDIENEIAGTIESFPFPSPSPSRENFPPVTERVEQEKVEAPAVKPGKKEKKQGEENIIFKKKNNTEALTKKTWDISPVIIPAPMFTTSPSSTANPKPEDTSKESQSLFQKYDQIFKSSNSSRDEVGPMKKLIKEVGLQGWKNNSEIFQLASLFQQSLAENQSKNPIWNATDDEIELAKIQQKFPLVVQNVVWGQQIQLKIMTEQEELRLTMAKNDGNWTIVTEKKNGKSRPDRVFFWTFSPVKDIQKEEERGKWFHLQNKFYRVYYVGMKVNDNDTKSGANTRDRQLTLDHNMNLEVNEALHWQVVMMCPGDENTESAYLTPSNSYSECPENSQFISIANRKYPDYALDIDKKGNIYLGESKNPGLFRVCNSLSVVF